VKTTARSLLFVVLFATVVHTQSRPQVLYVTQSAGFAHSVLPLTEKILTAIGQQHDAFDLDITRDASILTTDTLQRYDAVVFYTTGELPMTVDQQTAFLEFVRNGGGFIGIHSATDTFYDWPEYGELIGGYFDNHPWREEVSIRVEDSTHPATRHLGKRFQINDEIYQFKQWSRDRVNVLMSLDTASVDTTRDSVHRNDKDFALTWSHSYGKGRVFYTALGHEEKVWQDDRFQRLVVNGITWAIGNNRKTNNIKWRSLLGDPLADTWRGYRLESMPDGWQMVDGALSRVGDAGDIITIEKFEDFELRFEWKVEHGGNSGVFFGVIEDGDVAWHSGPEYQLLHNAGHPDGQAAITAAGSNYAVHPPIEDMTNPVGEWNRSRLLVRRGHVEHWMNGRHLLSYEIGNDEWQHRVTDSKFSELPLYGQSRRGHIAIQDHGDPIWFRNMRIRTLD
tara:strand:- start:4186 stop:5535 length:1350 start_codon:yes stop_codon:yes gene_type:complete